MTEPEVSLYIALHYIKNGLTDEPVTVSIDGAHIKTGNNINFDIWSFLKKHALQKIDGIQGRWQGEYRLSKDFPSIIIHSIPGTGDVNIKLKDGRSVIVESKKGKNNRRSQEYTLMREAIGQLMTGGSLDETKIPIVAVPWSEKSEELAERWSRYEQIKQCGIRFILVKENGELVNVGEIF